MGNLVKQSLAFFVFLLIFTPLYTSLFWGFKVQAAEIATPSTRQTQFKNIFKNPNLTASSSASLQFKGYLVEFKEDSLTEYKRKITAQKRISAQSLPDYKNKVLQPKHDEARQDILNRLGEKQSVVSLLQRILRQSPKPIKSKFLTKEYIKVFNGASLNITEKQLEEVKKSPFIKKVTPNYEVKTTLAQSVPLIKANEVWNLSDSLNNKVTGKGVTVAVIDTGIDYTHPDFGSCSKEQFLNKQCAKVADGYNFVAQTNDPMDDNGHGTHVSSTVAGVAPDVKIISYKILNQNGAGYFDDVIAAIEKSVDPNGDGDFSDHWDIINLSLGRTCNYGQENVYDYYCGPDDVQSQAVDRAVSAGVTAVIAAGNEGPGEQTVGSPGTARKAITVGASSKNDKIAAFSSRGAVYTSGANYEIIKPNIVAPGVSICAARLSTFQPWTFNPNYQICGNDDKHVLLSGTSMATPHIAGVAALIKQMHKDWSPEQIKSSIANTALDIGEKSLTQGSGRVNALTAIQAAGLITPGSLDFDFIGQPGNITKTLTIKNSGNKTNNYTFAAEGLTPGISVNLNPAQFSLDSKASKDVTVTVSVDNNTLPYGFYSQEIRVYEDGGNVYKIPVMVTQKGFIVETDPLTVNKNFNISVETPYKFLSSPPNVTLKSPSGKESSINLFRQDLMGKIWSWASNEIPTEEEGNYTLTVNSPEMAGVQKTVSLKNDLTKPNITTTLNPTSDNLNIEVSSGENLAEAYEKKWIDTHNNNGWYQHAQPSIFIDGKNVYAVFTSSTKEYYPGNSGWNYNIFDTGYFVKSNDWGNSWSNPVEIIKHSVGDNSFFSISKLNGELVIIYNDGFLYSRKSSDEGVTWSTSTKISLPDDIIDGFALKKGGNKLSVVYTGSTLSSHGSDGVLQYLSYDGTNWSLPKLLLKYRINNVIDGSYPINLDANDKKIAVVYSDFENVYYTENLDNGLTWSEMKKVAQLGYPKYTTAPGIGSVEVLVADNLTYIAWMDSYNYLINFTKSADGGLTWTNKTLSSPANFEDFPRLATAGNKLYLAFQRASLNSSNSWEANQIIQTSTDQGETWNLEKALDTNMVFSNSDFAVFDDTLHILYPATTKTGVVRMAYANSRGLFLESFFDKQFTGLINLIKTSSLWTGMISSVKPGTYEVNFTGSDLAGNTSGSTSSYTYELPPTQIINLKTSDSSWIDFIGLTLDKGSEYKAEDLIRDLNSSFKPATASATSSAVYKVEWQNPATHQREVHEAGSPDNNFPVVLGEGYFVRTNTSGQSTLTGTKPTLSSIKIVKGGSSISFPQKPENINTADDLIKSLQKQGIDVKIIDRWVGNKWEIHCTFQPFCPPGDINFNITPGEGYLVHNFGEEKTFQLTQTP